MMSRCGRWGTNAGSAVGGAALRLTATGCSDAATSAPVASSVLDEAEDDEAEDEDEDDEEDEEDDAPAHPANRATHAHRMRATLPGQRTLSKVRDIGVARDA